MIQPADRIQSPPGIFNELEISKRQAEANGWSVIDLGIGSPDQAPAEHVINALHQAIDDPMNYRYPMQEPKELYQAASAWYKDRFGVTIDPANEIVAVAGSQDGLAHLPLAYLNPGDIALVPDPGYPIYSYGVRLAGGIVHPLPLTRENNYLPDFSALSPEVLQSAKLMILNYPANPMAAVADRDFFEKVVSIAKRYDILVCHDVAYSELCFDGFVPMSFLEVPGAKDIGVEFFSLSKTYNLAGCRLGFMVGNSEVVANLAKLKSNIDYGIFLAIQKAGTAALTGEQTLPQQNAATYQRRRDLLLDGLAKAGWQIEKPRASMFVWAPLPPGYTSCLTFCQELLAKTGVVMVPGTAFGQQGEGFVRIALVQDDALLLEVVERIQNQYQFAK